MPHETPCEDCDLPDQFELAEKRRTRERREMIERQAREIRAWDNVGPSQNGRNAPYARRSRDTQRLRDMSDNDLRDAERLAQHGFRSAPDLVSWEELDAVVNEMWNRRRRGR